MKIDTPNTSAAVDGDGALTPPWVSFFTKVVTFIVANSQSGTTAQRPTKGLSPGDRYMDLTLGYPIFVRSVNPIVWVDGGGTVR